MLRQPWLRWGVLAAGVAVSVATTYFFHAAVQEKTRLQFQALALGTADDVEARVRAYGDVLYALRGLLDASDDLTRDDFHQFAQGLSLGERYPGLANISFAVRVPQGEKDAFEARVRAESGPLVRGLPPFSITPPGIRPDYTVLHYVEPMGPNVAAWGLDLAADPVRRLAVERARDSGRMTASLGVTLVRDRASGARSTLLRLAVYRGGGVPATAQERSRLYIGVVGSTLRVAELVEATLTREVLSGMRLRIFDARSGAADASASASPEPLLYDSAAQHGAASAPAVPAAFSAYRVSQLLPVADLSWRLEITPLRDPVGFTDRVAIAGALLISLTSSLLLFWLLGSVSVSLARNRALARSASEAAALLAFRDDLQARTTLQDLYLAVERQAPLLFPGTSGQVYTLDSTRQLQRVARWGQPRQLVDACAAETCVALRQQVLHVVADVPQGARCSHFTGVPPPCYACVPLTAQNDPIGMLHLQPDGPAPADWGGATAQADLLNAAAPLVALAIANLGLRDKLREQATRDALTGLFNRHYLQEWFDQETHRARRQGQSIGVILLDIDHFKRINDHFGHGAGDMVLRAVADTMRSIARRSDMACRHGGEEFLLAMPDATRAVAARKAEELRVQVQKLQLAYGGVSLGPVTLSAGVAVFPQDGEQAEVLRRADEAMYRAKEAGRNRVVVGLPGPGAGP